MGPCEDVDENMIVKEFPSFLNSMTRLEHLHLDNIFYWHETEMYPAPTNVDFQHLFGLRGLSIKCNFVQEVNRQKFQIQSFYCACTIS